MNTETPQNDNPVTIFGSTNFRNQHRRFGIKLDDRRRHMYIIGKTGTGKTTLMENMVLSDIYAGHGVAFIDPHGDTAEKFLDYIPSHRLNDVVYFNPADVDFPVGFNILETANDDQKHLVASGLMGVFKKIWPDVWSARMEYILLNCVLALLDYPGATLLGINRLLVDPEYRKRVIAKIRDPIVKTFWVAEFSSWSEKYATEAIAPVQNKVGQFLSASIIRNILAQVKSTIDTRQIMDTQKIFIVNLSKGKIGEDNMRLLGGMIITKLQLAAMERVDTPETQRKDFFMFVDEFQNFANPSFASILSEARKYRLSLILAHQYIEQLDETVRDAVFGNIGTLIAMRVGARDAEFMETEFTPVFLPEDLTNLPKFHMYLKLMVDGIATQPFSADTLPPIAQNTGSHEKVVRISRERYASPRKEIEEKVLRWSGMEAGELTDRDKSIEHESQALEYPRIETEDEQQAREDLQEATSAPVVGASPVPLEHVTSPPPPAVAPASPSTDSRSRREPQPELLDEAESEPTEYLRFSAERLAAIQSALPQQKKKKPQYKHTCTRCGKVWEMPVQLDPTRPMYCSECLPIIRDEKKMKGSMMKAAVRGKPPKGVDMREESEEANEFEKAMSAMEEGGKISTKHKDRSKESSQQNRPRIVITEPGAFEDLLESDESDEDDRSELLEQIEASRGAPVDRDKKRAVPPRESGGRRSDEPRPASGDSPEQSDQPKKPKRKRKRRPRGERREQRSATQSAPSSAGSQAVADEDASSVVFKSSSKPLKPGERITFG